MGSPNTWLNVGVFVLVKLLLYTLHIFPLRFAFSLSMKTINDKMQRQRFTEKQIFFFSHSFLFLWSYDSTFYFIVGYITLYCDTYSLTFTISIFLFSVADEKLILFIIFFFFVLFILNFLLRQTFLCFFFLVTFSILSCSHSIFIFVFVGSETQVNVRRQCKLAHRHTRWTSTIFSTHYSSESSLVFATYFETITQVYCSTQRIN